MKRLLSSLMVFILAGLSLASCIQAAQPSPTIDLKPPIVGERTPVPKAGWEQDWAATLAAAKKEGKLTVYSHWGPEVRIALSQAFKRKYDIEVEFAIFARTVENMARIQMEKRAGLNIVDIIAAGTGTVTVSMKPAGLLGPMGPLVILPEVIEPKAWRGGKFPFVDKDNMVIGFSASLGRNVMYNSDLIRKGEITSYKDVLKPQYKGKITLNDPTVAGQGATMMALLALRVWNVEEASDFLTQLVKQQEVVIQRDKRIHVETVARGKYAIGLAPTSENLAEFLNLGAPVEAPIVKEGTHITAGAGGIAVPPIFAHPNAAKIFVNWLLTKEGQTLFAQAYGTPSLRTDVSTEGVNPIFLPQPGEKIFLDDEEMLFFRTDKITDISKEIIDKAEKR